MKSKKTELIAIKLPITFVGVFGLLTLLAFTSSKIGAVIFIDKLILISIVLLPAVCILGMIVSIIALLTSKKKMTALTGIILNVSLLIVLLCVSKPFIVEFKLTLLGI